MDDDELVYFRLPEFRIALDEGLLVNVPPEDRGACMKGLVLHVEYCLDSRGYERFKCRLDGLSELHVTYTVSRIGDLSRTARDIVEDIRFYVKHKLYKDLGSDEEDEGLENSCVPPQD